ncbi:MAG: hypothetical protein GY804_02795 [Alphaproteobacteria bacterium]|nr:hypothetical protein [Alphaproteobacteria bacterium]
MIIHNLKQGSQEWLDFRLTKLTASEACIAKGISSYMGRNSLLEAKKLGKFPEVTKSEQHLFDQGHKAEASARSIAEEILACDLYPVTGSLDVEGLPLSASFDGITLENDIVWEHKLSNQTLRANLELDIIPEEYKYQLEQQLLVSGATKALFMASDGTRENCLYTMYESDPKIRTNLIDSWKQFQKDLEDFKPRERVEVLTGHKIGLPAVVYNINGTEISTNLAECIDKVRDLANTEMNKILETDQDFANKDQLNKDIKKARASLKEIVANVDSQFQTRQSFAESAKEMDSILQKMLSHGEKQVKQAKEARKADIANKAEVDLLNHAQKCDIQMNPGLEEPWMVSVKNIGFYPQQNWLELMKGKHKIASIQNAVDTRLAELKIEMDKMTEICDENITYYREVAEGYGALFNDLLEIVKHPHEAFKALVHSRIHEEEIRLQNERKRIREEEERKALAKVEAERERIRQEEEKKAREEAQEAKQQAEKNLSHFYSDPVEYANDIFDTDKSFNTDDAIDQHPELNNIPPKTELKASISESDEIKGLSQYFSEEDLGSLRHDEHGNEFMLEIIVKRSYLKY